MGKRNRTHFRLQVTNRQYRIYSQVKPVEHIHLLENIVVIQILQQTGNTTLYTVTFHKNNTYAKWSKTTGNESITKKFSKDTPYTGLIPDETPTWTEGSNLKYVFLGNYSTTTTGAAVTSGSLLTGDINLYARWSTASTGYVKVSWDPNGGQLSPTSGGTSTSNSIYDYHNPGAIKC